MYLLLVPCSSAIGSASSCGTVWVLLVPSPPKPASPPRRLRPDFFGTGGIEREIGAGGAVFARLAIRSQSCWQHVTDGRHPQRPEQHSY